MTEPTHENERRSEVRRGAPATRISWARKGSDKLCTGWVSDITTSGIAFVTSTREKPDPGEMILLSLNAGNRSPQHHTVRVAHISPHDQLFSLVACRTAAATEHQRAV